MFLLILFGIYGHSAKLFAHEGRPVYIQLNEVVDQTQTSYLLLWKIPPVLAAGKEPRISLQASDCQRAMPTAAPQALIGSKTYVCEDKPEVLWVAIDYPAENPALSSLIVFNGIDGNSQNIFSGPEQQLIAIPKTLSIWKVAKQYGQGGIKHMLLGFDHLLFIICLMIVAGSIPRILIAATGFTLAHTLTLILSSLNVVSVPAVFVEALIALSIVLLAVQIKKSRRGASKTSFTWRYPVLSATVFGLLHGLGFASVLGELGLPTAMRIPALLFFNFGVEIGQFVFIAVVLVVVFGYQKVLSEKTNQRLLSIFVYLIGVIASYWLIERIII